MESFFQGTVNLVFERSNEPIECVHHVPEHLYVSGLYTCGGVYEASTQAASSLLLIAVWMKCTPTAPSCTVGKSRAHGSGSSPASWAAMAWAALR